MEVTLTPVCRCRPPPGLARTSNPLSWRVRGRFSLLLFHTASGRAMGVVSDKYGAIVASDGLCEAFSSEITGDVIRR